MIWTKNQEQVINTHLSLYSDAEQVLYFWKPKEFDGAKFTEALAKSGATECFFSLSLTRANLFFKTSFVGHDSGGIKFRFPKQLYKVQRRKDLRFPIPDGLVIKAEFNDPVFPDKQLTRRVIDLSAGGLCLLISDSDAPLLPTGLVLTEISLNINGRTIKCAGEIRYVRPLPPDSKHTGFKLGVLFQNLRPGDQQHIASYVFEETRKYFSKFL